MKKWLKSPWSISLGTAVFSFLLTIVFDFLRDKPVLSTIWIVLQAIWEGILAFLNFELKIWWIILGIIGLLLIYTLSRSKVNKQTIHDFDSYTQDTFQHWKWSWNWEYSDYKKSWHITDLKAHCPMCNTPMIDETHYLWGLKFSCPRCNFHAEDEHCDEPHKVERVALDNIERKRKLRSS